MREVRRLLAVGVVASGVFGVTACAEESPTAPPPTTAGSSDRPGSLSLTVGAAGRCVPPTAEALGRLADVAFAAEVDEIGGGRVLLRPDEFFTGPDAPDRVEVRVPGAGVRTTEGLALEAGRRYLLAANEDGRVLVCGLSGPETPRLRRLYEQAF